MAIGAGISAQFGFKTETTWNTAVTVDKFLEFVDEGIDNDGGPRIVSQGLRGGRLVDHRAARGIPKIGGPVKLELPNINLATLLKHMFGTVATTGTGPWTHTATPGPLLGKSLTVQVGRPSIDGTVNPFTWSGVKIADWELAAATNQYAMLTPSFTVAAETTATALAAASYPAGLAPFTFVQSALTLAGSSVALNSFSLKASNGLKTDRGGPGSAVIREQITDSRKSYSGTITAEFESLTNYNRFLAATQAALVLTFSNGSDSFTITMNVELTGDAPKVSGPGILAHNLPFSVLSATSDAAAITAVLVNQDSSAT